MKKLLLLSLLLTIFCTPLFSQNSSIHSEDRPHISGDQGVAILLKRCDAASSSSGTDGDYTIPCTDANGNIRVALSTATASAEYWEYSGEITGTTWTTIKSGEVGYYLVVTFIKIINGDGTVGTDVFVYDDDDGDVTDSTLKDGGYAAALGGGWSSGNGASGLFSTGTLGNGLYVVCETTSSETHVTVRGYRVAVKPTY